MHGERFMIIQGAVLHAIKVAAGGAGVATASYVVTEKTIQTIAAAPVADQAQAWGVFAASACTAFYFAIMGLHTGWKFWQDVKASRKK